MIFKQKIFVLNRYLRRMFNIIFFAGDERDFMMQKINEIYLPKPRNTESWILVDTPHITNQFFENFALARFLSERTGHGVACYHPNIYLAVRSFTVRNLYSSISGMLRAPRLASQVGAHHGLSIKNVKYQDRAHAKQQSKNIANSLETKDQLVNFKNDGISIGRAVYDTYMRSCSSVTVDLDSPRLQEILEETLLIQNVTQRYFLNNDVSYVILGHAVYANWQIVSEIAVKHGAEVLVTANSRVAPVHWVNRNLGLQVFDHSMYKSIFDSFSKDEQEQKRIKGKKLIDKRLSGVIDDGINYMRVSPYGDFENSFKLDANKRHNIVFMLHAFSDSPHIYKTMVFPDFYEWIVESLKYIEENDLSTKYNIYIKPHPNGFTHESRTVMMLLELFSFVKLIPSSFNNKFLLSNPRLTVVSVHGTVSAEFASRKIPVILCGDNPTSSFSFAFEAKTKREYFELIERAEKLVVSEVQKKEVYEFLYMSNYHHTSISFSDFPFKRWKPDGPSGVFDCRYKNFEYNDYKEMMEAYFQRVGCLKV